MVVHIFFYQRYFYSLHEVSISSWMKVSNKHNLQFHSYIWGNTSSSIQTLPQPAPAEARSLQCFCFQILIKCLLDALIQKVKFQILNIIIFRGELTDISAKKETLGLCCPVFLFQPLHRFAHPDTCSFSLYQNNVYQIKVA